MRLFRMVWMAIQYHPFDVNMLTDKLKMLMKNDIMREQFTKHSQSNMDQFSKKKIVGNWIQLLEEIIE